MVSSKSIDLSPQEVEYIVKNIQQGRALPDQYRFKLFEHKQDVELLWDGKSPHKTNVVLPFQTIEVVDEPRMEMWGGVAYSM
jgi:hypothetical protein